jgi:hypothetical protein
MFPVYNNLMDLRKVLGSSAEMFYRGAFPGYSLEMHPELVAQGLDLDTEALRTEISNYSEGLQRWMSLKGVTAKALSPQVADPRGHLEAQYTFIAITLDIPLRIFMGSEQGQLASGQDMRSWSKRMANRQQKYITPMIIRPFVDRLIALGVLPEPLEGYKVDWPDLFALSDEEKARVSLVKTQTLSTYVGGGVENLVPPNTFLTQFVGMTEDEITAIDEEYGEIESTISESQGDEEMIPGEEEPPVAGPEEQAVPGEAIV